MWLSLLIPILTLSSLAQAKGSGTFTFYGDDSYQTYSCVGYLSSIATFCKTSSSSSGGHHHKRHRGSSSSCYCSSENALASVMGCMEDIGKRSEGAMKYYIKYCEKLSVSLTMSDLEEAYEYYETNATYTSDIANFSSSSVVSVPIKSNVTAAKKYYLSEYIFLGNFDRSVYYGAGALGYWAAIFLAATIANWSVVIFPSLRTTFNGPISKFWRKYVTLPALARKKKNDHQKILVLFNCLVPSRMESIIVFIFFWMIFAMCVAHIQYISDDPIFSDDMAALVRVIADRTGIMGTVIFPLLFLLAGRNNFLQWLTRWKYSTFVMYHRWMARIVVALIFVHAVCYTADFVILGTFKRHMMREYIHYGIAATVSGSLMCFQGLLFLRRKAYEIFLVVHILLAIGWVVGAWKHLANLGYMPFVYATVAVWAFDRLVRLIRIALFGFPKAKVSLVEDEVLRIVVPRPKYWKSAPGGHAWLHLCWNWNFWQSHPFTFLESVAEDNEIVFLCKVKKGITSRLAKKLANLPGRSFTCRVAVEGPYGESCPVQKHSSAVFVAGGNGIPGMFSEVYDLARRSANHSQQKLKLFWVLREAKSIAWMFTELQALKSTKVETTIYITKPDSNDGQELAAKLNESYETSLSEKQDSELKKSDSEEDKSMITSDLITQLREQFPHIEFELGRPSVDEIVQTEIEEANHSVAFVTCGHPAMVDDLRASVAEKLDTTNKRVDFFEQLQVWA